MGKIITIANQKGGVGKTTTAIALAHGLNIKGYKTLLYDNDPQCNSTDTYRADIEGKVTAYDIMKKTATAQEGVQETSKGDIIAADKLLATADNEFLNVDRSVLLKKALAPLKDKYDFIIIDNNPSLGVLLGNSLVASDYVIVPISPGRYSLQGIVDLNDTVIATKDSLNPNLKVLGMFMTITKQNTNAVKDVLDTFPQIAVALETVPFKTFIRETTKVRDAENARLSIFEYAPDSTAAQDYMSLIDEILERI